jgi:hypothetical protein
MDKVAVFFSIFFLLCSMSGCESARHVLEFRNVSTEEVYFQAEGIRLYRKGRGPQKLSGHTMSYSVMGPLWLSYPIKVSWESKESRKRGYKEFVHIPGVAKGVEKVTEGGTLVVGLTADFDIKLFFTSFNESGAIDSSRYEKILLGELPMPK